MFDNIGQTHDEGAGQRRAASVVLLTTIGGGLLATVFVITAWTAQQIVTTPVEPDFEMVEQAMPVEIEDPLPAVPAPPPPAMARGEQIDPAEPDPVVPDELLPPETLIDPPTTAVADAAPLSGTPDGVDGADPNGDPDGVIGGVDGGTGDRLSATSAVPTVHRSEVRIKRPVTPDYPDVARDMNLGDVSCRVNIVIGEDGVAEDMTFDACPAVFHDSVRTAVARMRWYPYRVGGQKSRARFAIQFNFRPGR